MFGVVLLLASRGPIWDLSSWTSPYSNLKSLFKATNSILSRLQISVSEAIDSTNPSPQCWEDLIWAEILMRCSLNCWIPELDSAWLAVAEHKPSKVSYSCWLTVIKQASILEMRAHIAISPQERPGSRFTLRSKPNGYDWEATVRTTMKIKERKWKSRKGLLQRGNPSNRNGPVSP